MALTQRTGVLANAGAQAQSVASTLANLASNLHYTGGGGQPQKSYGQEPVYYAPAPVNTYRPPQQTGSFSSGSSAAAAQHLLTQARNQQQVRQNVFNDVAKQAVLTALAVATGQQPGRSYQAPPTLQYRQGSDAAGHQLTPQQESQLFDQQIQATKLAASQQAMPGVFTPDSGTRQRINGFNANIDTMRSGFTNARPNPRLTQEGQVLSAFPQMTPQELRTRSGSQLQAMLDLAKQPPASAAGSSDQVGGQETSPNDMTRSQPPKGPPPQPPYSPLPTWDTTLGAPAQPPYNPLPTGAAQVSQAMEGAMKPFGVEPGAFEQTSGDTMGGDSGGGGFWDTVGNVIDAGLHAGGPVNPIALFESLVENGKDIASYFSPDFVTNMLAQLKDGAAGTYEAFVTSAPGQVIEKILNGLDIGRQWNTGNVGALAYRTATKSPFLGPGDWDSDHYISLMPPLALAFEAAYRADPTLEARVVDWHDNGYSSPSYIKTAEAAGIDWHEQPQFTGDQAVYEGLMGLTDQMPAVLKYPFRMATDILLDPLSMLTVAAKGGAVARELGIGLRTAEDATLGGRVIGGILEGTGAAVEGGARLPDLPVEALIRGGKGVGGKLGEVTGLLSPSTAGRRIEASADIARLSDDIAGARESVPDVEMRTAFDAEAQGVAPTSGPELIGTPVARTETPTVVAREGGEPTVIRSTGTATVDRGADTTASVTGATGTRYPTFESLRDAPNSTAAKPVKVYSYNGQDLLIRSGVARDGVPFYSASPVRATKVNQMVTRDSYTDLMDALPSEFGGSHPPFNPGAAKAVPTANETALADVNKQIKAAQADLRSSNPDKMMVAAEKLKLLNAERARLRGEITAERAAKPKPSAAPPVTKAEREAAAAAGSTPDTPRSPGASETVRAAENAKATTGKGRQNRLSASDRRSYGALAKAEDRAKRLAKEDREGLPKEVNKILAAQKPGEHEFSPIYGGHRPLDQIVTKAIESKDPALMKKADAFVKKVDQAVEQHLRPDPFYRTWKNGGAPVFTYSPSGAFADDFFEAFRVLEPDADPGRLRVLANGLAKGTLDDIAELQFQLNHLLPMLTESYADEFTLDGIFGAVGRIESKDYKAESSRWLIREYLDTPKQAEADKILHTFLTGETEAPLIADGIHKPYAHSIVDEYQAESIARLQEMRAQWRTIKRAEQVKNFAAVREQSDAPFREADIPAQLEGGKKGISKQMAAAMRATKHSVKATDEAVTVAIGEIKDAEIAHWLLNGDGKLTIEQAKLADRAMPATWRPTGYIGGKTEWNVKEALDWIQNEHARHPSFDYAKARDDIGQLAYGLQPKMTPAQVKAARKAAEAQGIDPKTIVDGSSAMERATATRGIRALDAYLRQYRALRLFNPIIGMGNRIGDVAGNSLAHLIGRDVRSALRQAPMTFTEANALRRLGRDPEKLVAKWVEDTPMMRELGAVYDPRVGGGARLRDIDATTGLPPVNAKVAGTPRAVRTAASAWSSPALKDATTAGEMVGRKLASDRVVAETIQREAWPAFKEYLEGRFPGQSDQLLKDIYTSAKEKGGKEWSGYFSAGDVEKAVDVDASRKWQREVNRAIGKGGDEADHLFFNGRMTNADEIARRVLTFHFWMARASALYGRTVLRNPVLLSGLYRVYERAQEIAQEQQLPGWLGTMMKFYTIPGAGSGYAAMDPIGALFPTFFLDAYSQEGNKFQALQNLMLPPWSAALGALGLTQNVPDLAGTRTLERFVIDMGNFLKGEGVDLEAIPLFGQYINTDSLTFKIPTEEFTKALIAKANDLLGEPLGTFTPFDRAANEHDQLYSIGEQIGQGLWGEDMTQWSASQIEELTNAVAQAQYGEGEETWLSETIRAAYGREGAARAFGALAIPGGVVTRQGFRDSQTELSHGYWDDFYAGKPTTKAGESAALGRQLATSAQPAWIAMNTDYYQIGTKQEQTMYSSVNDMLFSPGDLNPHQAIIIDNGNGMFTVYNMSQLAALSDDERQQVVYAWLDQNKGVSDAYTKVKDGRAAFKADHPDYAQYSEYQKGVFGYQGGPTQFRRDMADNPTFKAAEDAKRAELKKQGKTGAVLEAELDHWATTQEAFFAATGQKYKADDTIKGTPGPSSVAAMFSLRPDKESSGSGGTKKEAPKDPTVNDYWSPAKGIPRLQEDQAQFEHDNAAMEATFGQYWNESAHDWEDNADSAKERDKLGIGDIPYVMPSVSETMRRYEEWEYRNPGGSPEEFFAEMLQTPGFGKKVGGATTSTPALPGGTVVTKPTGVSAAPTTAGGKLQAAVQNLKHVTNAPKPGSRPEEAGDAAQVIGVANSFVGKVPYVWGGIPGKGDAPTGWDCSGMTYWLDQNYGSGQLPMGSHYQYQYAQDTGQLFTDMSQLQPGDIVFIDTGWMGGAGSELNRSGHVGIYAGNGQLINALNPDAGTVIEPLTDFGNVLGAMHGSWTSAEPTPIPGK